MGGRLEGGEGKTREDRVREGAGLAGSTAQFRIGLPSALVELGIGRGSGEHMRREQDKCTADEKRTLGG